MTSFFFRAPENIAELIGFVGGWFIMGSLAFATIVVATGVLQMLWRIIDNVGGSALSGPDDL